MAFHLGQLLKLVAKLRNKSYFPHWDRMPDMDDVFIGSHILTYIAESNGREDLARIISSNDSIEEISERLDQSYQEIIDHLLRDSGLTWQSKFGEEIDYPYHGEIYIQAVLSAASYNSDLHITNSLNPLFRRSIINEYIRLYNEKNSCP